MAAGRWSFVAESRGTFAPVDGSINEVYAFHGTQVRYALAIAENAAELRHEDLDLSQSYTTAGFNVGRTRRRSESTSRAQAPAHCTVEGHIWASLSARQRVELLAVGRQSLDREHGNILTVRQMNTQRTNREATMFLGSRSWSCAMLAGAAHACT